MYYYIPAVAVFVSERPILFFIVTVVATASFRLTVQNAILSVTGLAIRQTLLSDESHEKFMLVTGGVQIIASWSVLDVCITKLICCFG